MIVIPYVLKYREKDEKPSSDKHKQNKDAGCREQAARMPDQPEQNKSFNVANPIIILGNYKSFRKILMRVT